MRVGADARARARRSNAGAAPGWLGLRVAMFLLVCAWAASPALASGVVELDDRVFDLARQLRCPVCVSESVADSNAQISIEMRDQIRELLAEGRSEEEVRAFFQERYGDWILLEPPRQGIHLIVWWLPWIAAGTGAVVLAVLVARWIRKGRQPVEADRTDLERVRSAIRGDRDGEGA